MSLDPIQRMTSDEIMSVKESAWKTNNADMERKQQEVKEKKAVAESQSARSNVAKFNDEKQLTSLSAKVKAGLELSKDELKFLEHNKRETYDNAVAVVKEKQAYEKRVQEVVSKTDVNQMTSDKVYELSNATTKVAEATNIGKGQKQAELEGLAGKVAVIESSYVAEVKSVEFEARPIGGGDFEPRLVGDDTSFEPMPLPGGGIDEPVSDADVVRAEIEATKAKISAALEKNYREQTQEQSTTHEKREFLTQSKAGSAPSLQIDKKG